MGRSLAVAAAFSWLLAVDAMRQGEEFPLKHLSLMFAAPKASDHRGQVAPLSVSSSAQDWGSAGPEGSRIERKDRGSDMEMWGFSGNGNLPPDKWAELVEQVTGASLDGALFSGNDLMTVDGWTALLRPLTLPTSSIKKIDFTQCFLDDEKADAIGDQLSRVVPTLRRLDMGLNGELTPKAWRSMLHPMTQRRLGWEEVSFSGNLLNDAKASPISEHLTHMSSTMRLLHLEGNPSLSPTGWDALLRPMSEHFRNLEEVSFDWCQLTDAHAQAIGLRLARMPLTIKVLDFGGNSKLSPRSWDSLLGSLYPVGSLLEEVSFGMCDLDDATAELISDTLIRMPPTVRAVKFGGNERMFSDSWAGLLYPLTNPSSGLSRVNFQDCAIDNARAYVISEELGNMAPSVESLNFEGNAELTCDGWTTLLRPLTLLGTGLVDVNFAYCDLNDAHARSIASELERAVPCVRTLDFSGNYKMDHDGWRHILHPMTKMGFGLEELILSNCNLDQVTATMISLSLENLSPVVKKINCAGNHRLTAEGWSALLKPLSNPRLRLEEVNFENCDLDDEVAMAIGDEMLKLPPTLDKLTFAGRQGLTADKWVKTFAPVVANANGLTLGQDAGGWDHGQDFVDVEAVRT